MTLSPAEQDQIASIWGTDPRDVRGVLHVTVDRFGRYAITRDFTLLPPLLPAIIKDLQQMLTSAEQTKRRQDAYSL